MTNRGLPGSAVTTAPLPGTTNTREVGGFAGLDGRAVARGRLYRGDVLGSEDSEAECRWSADYADGFRALGLRLVVDLRSDPEVEAVPSAWGDGTGARLVRAPIPEGVQGSHTDFERMLNAGEITHFSATDLGRWYGDALDRRATVFAGAVGEIAAVGGAPALVHCHAGKDRTGLLIALILDALGVSRDEILADYEATAANRRHVAEASVPVLESLGVRYENVRSFWETPPVAMSVALDHLDSRYGGTVGYLVQAGLDPHAVESLRDGLLDS